MTEGNNRVIYLRTGQKCLVSLKDFEWLDQFAWRLSSHGYVWASFHGKAKYMHRIITECPAGMCVDHMDGDKQNNTRENLRVCRQAQNCANTSRVNVFQTKERNWTAQIVVDYKVHTLGVYKTREEADLAYSSVSLFYKGEYAQVPYPNASPKNADVLKAECRQKRQKERGLYFGVHQNDDRFEARISIRKKQIYLGVFKSAREAAQAYDAAIDLYGRPAWQKNFYLETLAKQSLLTPERS